MAIDCTPEALVSGSSCLDCKIPVGQRPAVIAYLLAVIAGGSTNLATLLAAATNAGWWDQRLSPKEYEAMTLYMLCAKLGTTTTCDAETAVAAVKSFFPVSPKQISAIEIYILADLAGISNDSQGLINLAVAGGYTKASVTQLSALSAYLTAVITGSSTTLQTVFSASTCWQCIDGGILKRLVAYLWCQYDFFFKNPAGNAAILLESGGYLLLESGGKILLE